MKTVLLFLLLSSSFIFSQTVYVNYTTGNDATGDGSAGNPYRTFYKGYTQTPSGGTLDLTGTFTWTNADEEGDIATNGFNINQNITIQGHGPGVSVVQAHTTSNSADRRIFTINSSVTVNLNNLELRYGYCTAEGGAINLEGTLAISECYFHDNISTQVGGAIFTYPGSALTILNSTLSLNRCIADGGGALLLNCSSGQITNCTFFGNSSALLGGAIYLFFSSAAITNTTIANNSCMGDGAGISQETSSEAVVIKNSILANNVSSYGVLVDYELYSGNLTDHGANIVEFGGEEWGTGTLTGSQPGLNLSSTLETNNAMNGVPTLKLTAGSVAINAGSDAANGSVPIPTTDQRGALRNGFVDIGAYEYWGDDGALPVELASFTAAASGRKVTLIWQTASEVNNFGFRIERSDEDSNIWKEIGFVEGHGNSNSEKRYEYTDLPGEGNSFRYRLKQTDNDGQYRYSEVLEVNLLPMEFVLKQNYPNPFNPSTTIEFSIPYDAQVEIKIYNSLGTELVTIYNEFTEAGVHKLDYNAAGLSSGIYYYRLSAGEFTRTKKLVLLK